jgi:hypothetical protein
MTDGGSKGAQPFHPWAVMAQASFSTRAGSHLLPKGAQPFHPSAVIPEVA